MELPEQLKANRERLGLSQEDVAHEIYVSRQTMSSWENGKTYPDVQSLLLLSQLFGTSIDELVKGDVVSMKDMISKDAVTMERLAWGVVFLILAGVACMVGLPFAWEEPSVLPHFSWGFIVGIGLALVLFALGLACANRIERIKKDHNLVSYREISAFMEGEEIPADDNALGRSHPFINNALKLTCGAGVGLIIAFIITWIVNVLR